jgi:cell wall-associated NlpC family hydrolase
MFISSSTTRDRAAGIAALVLGLTMGVRAEVVLKLPADLSAPRRELVTKALEFSKRNPDVPYLEGGADTNGMDCSGAVVRLMKLVNVEPPRTAHGQYEWLKNSGRLTPVPAGALTAAAPVFRSLQPGDLVFWARDIAAPAGGFHISHVHMYLGEEGDGHRVMIGSSDGRSYRGKKIHGFGIVDYRVPKPGSPTRIVGFGSPFPSARNPSLPPANPPPTQP